MHARPSYYPGLLVLFAAVLLTGILSGCAKEYSFESGATPPPIDTIHPPPPPVVPEFPVCASCNSSSGSQLSEWSFKYKTYSFCGRADTAIMNLERTAFTFFGHSACSSDSGMAITIYLDHDTLNRDKSNLLISRNAFYYYDRVTPSYIFMSQPSGTFSVTITRYDHATRIVTGTFTGNTIRANGNGAGITDGKFVMKVL